MLCVHGCVCHSVQVAGQRATLWDQCSPFSFPWVLEITLRPDLHGKELFLAEPSHQPDHNFHKVSLIIFIFNIHSRQTRLKCPLSDGRAKYIYTTEYYSALKGKVVLIQRNHDNTLPEISQIHQSKTSFYTTYLDQSHPLRVGVRGAARS